jgi:hypothetical protein
MIQAVAAHLRIAAPEAACRSTDTPESEAPELPHLADRIEARA